MYNKVMLEQHIISTCTMDEFNHSYQLGAIVSARVGPRMPRDSQERELKEGYVVGRGARSQTWSVFWVFIGKRRDCN